MVIIFDTDVCLWVSSYCCIIYLLHLFIIKVIYIFIWDTCFCKLVISHMQLSRCAVGRLFFRYCCINLFIITAAGYFNYLLYNVDINICIQSRK